MPLKINIAMSRKVGESNYGSRGATVGLEIEEDVSLVNQPQQLHQRLTKLFDLAKEAVDHQLDGPLSLNRRRLEADTIHNAAARTATPAQVRAIYAIMNSQQLDPVAELQRRFGVERAEN